MAIRGGFLSEIGAQITSIDEGLNDEKEMPQLLMSISFRANVVGRPFESSRSLRPASTDLVFDVATRNQVSLRIVPRDRIHIHKFFNIGYHSDIDCLRIRSLFVDL